MEYRQFGNTDIQISAIGFGGGATAGLFSRGDPKDRREVVARALDLGINYFDTAPGYDATLSESGLGQALGELKARPIIGTKISFKQEDLEDMAAATAKSVEGSLQRLGVDTIDLLQVHNKLSVTRRPEYPAELAADEVLGPGGALEAFEQLQKEGKVRYIGISGIGQTQAIQRVIDEGRFNTQQAYYTMLNPSAGQAVPSGFRNNDYGQIIDRAAAKGMGTLIIRPLAAGALAGAQELHPLAGGWSRGAWYEVDADRARVRALDFLLDEGSDATFAQVAIRFALAKKEASVVVIGFSSMEQMEEAVSCVGKPGLSQEQLEKLQHHYHAD